MKLTATVSDNTATALSTGGTGSLNAVQGVPGTIQSVRIESSADTTVSAVIADEVGTVFTIGSTDFTTAVQYEYGNAAIVRSGTNGKLTATVSGIGSGTVTVTVMLAPTNR